MRIPDLRWAERVLKQNCCAKRKSRGGIVNYLAIDLLSPEAIEIAKREYQSAILEEAERKHQDTRVIDLLVQR